MHTTCFSVLILSEIKSATLNKVLTLYHENGKDYNIKKIEPSKFTLVNSKGSLPSCQTPPPPPPPPPPPLRM